MKKKRNFLLGCALFFFVVSCGQDNNSIKLEIGKTITLRGVIKEELHYGPPNFGYDPKNDEKIYVKMFYLDSPVSFLGTEFLSEESVENMEKLHMAFCEVPEESVGKKVEVIATTEQEFSPYHYTPVLLDDCKIEVIE